MNEIESVIARRLAFLEREFDRMGGAADDAEHDLEAQSERSHRTPTARGDLRPGRQDLGRDPELRARQPDHQAVIRYDHHADRSADRAYRQALL